MKQPSYLLTATSTVIDGETLSYLDNKQGKISLLFLHGAFINKDYWLAQLTHFAPHYRVLAVDLAGHGQSSTHRKTYSIQEYGKDIHKFLQQLDLKQVILIGHSIGAAVMLEVTVIAGSTIKGLIGIDYFKQLGVELPKETIQQLMDQLNNDFANTCAHYAEQALLSFKTAPVLKKRILAAFTNMNPLVGIPLNGSSFVNSPRELHLLRQLSLDLQLINVDYAPTEETLLQHYLGPRYHLQQLQGTCHYPMLEEPELLSLAIEKSLQQIIF
ncbi:MAG: alpha/beta fold hydrolase [Aureispira sp.]